MKKPCEALVLEGRRETPMSYSFLIIVLLIAITNWIAVEKKWKIVEYITKPGTMIALLVWLGLNDALGGSMIWFTLGAIFSLAGDILLILPREQFVAGLVSFLLGQLAYIIGFFSDPPVFNFIGVVLALIFTANVVWIYRHLAVGLEAKGERRLKAPVLIYSIVITIMVFSALMTLTNPNWGTLEALLVSAGAILFYLSDTLLAWNRFVAPIPHSGLVVMITYQLGQIGILTGAATFYFG